MPEPFDWLQEQVKGVNGPLPFQAAYVQGRAVGRRQAFEEALHHLQEHPVVSVDEVREKLLGEVAVGAVVEFLDAWRFCPVSEASGASRSCLTDAATQLLESLRDKAFPPEGESKKKLPITPHNEGGDGVGAGADADQHGAEGDGVRPSAQSTSADSVSTSTRPPCNCGCGNEELRTDLLATTSTQQGGDAFDLRGQSGCAGKRHVARVGLGDGSGPVESVGDRELAEGEVRALTSPQGVIDLLDRLVQAIAPVAEDGGSEQQIEALNEVFVDLCFVSHWFSTQPVPETARCGGSGKLLTRPDVNGDRGEVDCPGCPDCKDHSGKGEG